MNNYIRNYEMVSRPRTWGRGIHLIYDENKHIRRHARRFLKWCNERRRKVANIDICEYGGEKWVRIPGFLYGRFPHETIRGYKMMTLDTVELWDAKHPREIIFLYRIGDREMEKNLAATIDYKFVRDGEPNHYDDDATIYDEWCLRRNIDSFKTAKNTWRDEIISEAKRRYSDYCEDVKFVKFCERFRRLSAVNKRDVEAFDIHNFGSVRKVMEYAKQEINAADFPNWIKGTFITIMEKFDQRFVNNAIRECHYERASAHTAARQLRALGFVA